MTTKEKLVSDSIGCVRKNMLKGILNSLGEQNQEYFDCLIRLKGQEISLNGATYVLTYYDVLGEEWFIEKHGKNSWSIKFTFVPEKHGSGYSCQYLNVVYSHFAEFSKLTEELFGLVVHILSTFHPNGETLTYTE